MKPNGERGAGTSEVIFIIALAVYFNFMGYLGLSLGYTSSLLGGPGAWTLPTIHITTGGIPIIGWLIGATIGIVDILIVVVNLLGYVLQMLVSYVTMIGLGFTGAFPVWISAFLFVPFSLGMGWMILSLIRGRE